MNTGGSYEKKHPNDDRVLVARTKSFEEQQSEKNQPKPSKTAIDPIEKAMEKQAKAGKK